jgi:outer membrane protein assembly factor BamA
MRVNVTVEEWPALRLRYGVQVAEERPEDNVEGRELRPGLSADLVRRTVFGRSVTLGGVFELQRREQVARLFVNTPTFFGTPIQSSLVADRSRETFEAVTLVTERTGVTWEQRARVAASLSLSYAYRFERNHTFDTEPPPGVPAFDVIINIGRLTGSAAWDTRDDPADATRGLLASSSVEFAPGAAGSDIRFVRQLAQVYYFRPWRNLVLASAGRLGVVTPLGGQELLSLFRFFAGGARTVRGVAEDSLGEVDFFGDPVGGRTLLVLNQEARVPIYRWVRGVAFVDAGNVFPRFADLRLVDLVGSIGAGLRVATPFALLRLDYARSVWHSPEYTSGRWYFGIGHAF